MPVSFRKVSLFLAQGRSSIIKIHGSWSYQALWRNLNIFHKQVSYEGYNPLHLKGFEEMADNHPKLFETILQNPLVYLADRVSPLDSLPFHEQDRKL